MTTAERKLTALESYEKYWIPAMAYARGQFSGRLGTGRPFVTTPRFARRAETERCEMSGFNALYDRMLAEQAATNKPVGR